MENQLIKTMDENDELSEKCQQYYKIDEEQQKQSQNKMINMDKIGQQVKKPKATIRGKGRPKGQKNSGERQKKNKNISSIQNYKRGHWSLDQNKRYHWFLQIYNKHFICKQMRRLDKIFKTMANFIGSRQAQQCRSHHQKMEKKYHSFPNITLYLRKFHYGSQDTKTMQQDMIKNNINETITFLNPLELQNLQQNQQQNETNPLPQQSKIDYDCPQNHKQSQLQSNFINFLDEDYQLKLQLNYLML